MARLARLVLPGIPHHVTQRGNRREPTFFQEADYILYRRLIAEAAAKAGVEIWAYCLMPNHVHLIAVPADAEGLRRTFADAHRRYTRHINARNGWTGHLWQGRFGAVAMDETHLAYAMRYVTLNPVRARLVERAEDWPWSSARAHRAGRDDELVRTAPALDRYGGFAFLAEQSDRDDEDWGLLRRAETIGRPLGSPEWIARAEARTGRALAPRKPGPKARDGQLSKLSPE